MDNNSGGHIRTLQQVVVKPYRVGINCQTLLFQKLCIRHLECYKAVPRNTTNCSLSNYTWIDVDGCLEGTDESRNGTERNGINRGRAKFKNRLKQIVHYFQLSHNN